MSRFWVGAIAFTAGVLIGLEAAKLYAQSTIKNDVDTALGKLGLGGGAIQGAVDGLIPVVVN